MGAPRFVMDDFWPSDLFLGGIPGAWYDPTDLSTMFQDNTGLTPVTAVEQPVGLIFDKSQGTPAARYNLLTQTETFTGAPWLTGSTAGAITRSTISTQDPTGATSNVSTVAFPAVPAGQFSIVYQDSGATYLNVNVTWSVWLRVASGTATIYLNVEDTAAGPGGGNFFASPALTLTTTWQRFTLTGTRTASTGNLGVFFGFDTRASAGQTNAAPLTVQVWGAQLQTGSTATTYQRITTGTGGEWTPGNHASQSTAASRPTYRARYNLLTFSEDFGNAAWTATRASVAISTAVSPPSGVTTFYKLTEDSTASNTHLLLTSADTVVTNGARYTSSIYARAAERTWIALQEGQGVTATAYFNLATGALGTISGTGSPTAAIESVGGGWYRCTISWTASGSAARVRMFLATGDGGAIYTGNGTSGVYASGAQILTAADVTATGNAYQRIAAATVYDTAPIFRPYLAFDGVDDSLSTAAINFTTTNKMTVFVGASKLSDVAAAILTELSATTASNAGSFYIAAPEATGASGNFTYKSRGSLDITPTSPGVYLAPTTRVLSGIGDIAGDTAILRINGAQAVNSTGDQGTGNYGNYPLFIGRRGGTTLPFNGRLFSLIVRGAASSVTEIADTELWVNARTGAY